ncbi:MAG: radical SAM protein [Nanoarchaeota archaeon]|nr:radical SAM protein [Nanoarchaeota archaeon]
MKQIIKIARESRIPLIGVLPFGIIDRNTSLLQIRPNTSCNLKCLFCSTSANDQMHPVNYEIEHSYLLDWIKELIDYKETNIEANLDSCGEILIYKELLDLVKGLKKLNVEKISMQTNGLLLTESLIDELEKAGLDKINLSIHTLDQELANQLAGTPYNLKHLLKIINLIKKSKIELWITPVYIPSYENEMISLIKFAKENKLQIAIQKYETYKYSRKMKVKEQTFYNFYKKLTEWEKEFNIKLKYGTNDFNIKKTKKLPLVFKKGEKIQAKVILHGWYKNQMMATSKNRIITILNCNKEINSLINITILDTKNSIYIGK